MFKSLRWAIGSLGLVGVLAAIAIACQGLLLQKHMTRQAEQVFVAQNVVADILPAPMYLIEARLVLSQAIEGTVPVAQAQKEFDALVAAYERRVAYWLKNPPIGFDSLFINAQRQSGDVFIGKARQLIFAPLSIDNAELAKTRLPQVHAAYLAHRANVDKTVGNGNKISEVAMKEFERTIVFTGRVMGATALLCIVVVLLVYRLVRNSIDNPLPVSTTAASQIAAGDLQDKAERSADAAKEIKGLIDGSVARVLEGSALADNARSTMSDMVLAIQRVTDIMAEISKASGKQSSELAEAAEVGEVADAVLQMDVATQQNASLVQEIAVSGSNLKKQSNELVELMSQFKVANSAARPKVFA
jgi:methyl-accepting chemotaxis protein